MASIWRTNQSEERKGQRPIRTSVSARDDDCVTESVAMRMEDIRDTRCMSSVEQPDSENVSSTKIWRMHKARSRV